MPGTAPGRSGTVALDPGVDVDVADLRRTAVLAGLPGGPRGGDALDWLLGVQELLVGWDDDWVLHERERVQWLRIRALERLSGHAREVGDVAGALVAATAASDIESSLEESDRPVGSPLSPAGGRARAPAARSRSGPTRAAARAGLAGALLVCAPALAFAFVLALSGPNGPPPPAETTRPAPTRPAAAQLVPAQVLQVEPRQLTVRASGAVESVTLMITATRRPAPVRLALWSTSGERLAAAQQIVVRGGGERFTWRGLAAGVYRWQATSPTATHARGRVRHIPHHGQLAKRDVAVSCGDRPAERIGNLDLDMLAMQRVDDGIDGALAAVGHRNAHAFGVGYHRVYARTHGGDRFGRGHRLLERVRCQNDLHRAHSRLWAAMRLSRSRGRRECA